MPAILRTAHPVSKYNRHIFLKSDCNNCKKKKLGQLDCFVPKLLHQLYFTIIVLIEMPPDWKVSQVSSERIIYWFIFSI